MSHVIEVDHLVKEYKNLRAVNDLSFTVEQGEILGLLGPNGSGKSTTINCILSLLSYQSGNIRIFGEAMRPSAYDLKRKIGVVFQEVAVFEELSVYDNINYFCGLYVKDRAMRKQYVEDAIALVELQDFKKFMPKQLSGGLLRRLNIACGIAHKPELIFLDEPTVAVDPQSRNAILEGIKELNRRGASIVYTSHYMEEVEILCDRVMILDKGKLLASGTCDELKQLARIEEKISVEIHHLEEKHQKHIQAMDQVESLRYDGQVLQIIYKQGQDHLLALMDYLRKEQIPYHRIYSERPTLNDVFLELTGKELRD